MLPSVSTESHQVSHRTPTHVVRHGEERRSCSPSGLVETGPGKFHSHLLTLTCTSTMCFRGANLKDLTQAIFGLFEGPNLVAYTMSETWLFHVTCFRSKTPGCHLHSSGLVFSTYPCRSLSEKRHPLNRIPNSF